MNRCFTKYGNHKIFLLITFILISSIVFSQNSNGLDFKDIDSTRYLITYTLKYKHDSLNLNKIKTNETWLFLGDSISYCVDKSMYTDLQTMSKHKTRADVDLWAANRGPYKSRLQFHIHKYYAEGILTYSEKSIDANYMYKEKLNAFNWELSNDTAKICGYRSQKAVCKYGGRKWIAWFTTEIPISDGPYKFNGLPGLIVKIYDFQSHYTFEIKQIEKPSNLAITKIIYPYLHTTKEKFFMAIENFREDIINRVKEAGGGSYSQQVAARNLARKNNHIELKPN